MSHTHFNSRAVASIFTHKTKDNDREEEEEEKETTAASMQANKQ